MIYLSFPASIMGGVWYCNRRNRPQMVQFVAQAAMLEQIWQDSSR